MLKTIFIFILFAYIFFAVFAFFFSDHMIFLPPRSSYKDTDNIIKLKTKDGATISAIYLPNEKAKYVILFSHGNAEDLGYTMPFLKDLNAQGFSVFSYDYHGYGTSQGRSTEQRSYNDINAAYDYLINNLKISPENIIAFGRSLGAAIAIDLAARKSIGGLIIESCFVSAFRVMTRIPILPFDKFNSIKKIKKIHCPVLVIHGTKDTIIPFWHGEKLFAAANSPKQYYWIKNADHNDPFWMIDLKYWEVVRDFADQLKTTSSSRGTGSSPA